MAVINYYDDILETASKTETIQEPISIRDLVQKYIEEKSDDSQIIEIYHADTDTTEYKKVEPDTYKIVALVDGQETPLEYIVEAEVVVSIMFIPESNNGILGGILVTFGIGLALTGLGLGLFAGTAGWFTIGGAKALGALTVMAMGALAAAGGVALLNDGKKSIDDKGDQEKLPYLNGAENEKILGNRYLFTMGKHLLSPRIVGDPYHETKVLKNGMAMDGGQIYHVLYNAGYGPLRVTDIKLGENIIAYNRSTSSAQRNTILHGQLSGTGTDRDDGDITIKYKNNDIKIEILQAGDKVNDIGEKLYAWKRTGNKITYTKSQTPVKSDNVYDKYGNITNSITYVNSTAIKIKGDAHLYNRKADSDINVIDIADKYGTIYPETVLEKEINANCLYVYDKDIEETQKQNPASILYYNRSVPIGFRNNAVYMSNSCPRELEVELDFESGLFSTNQTRSSKKSDYKTKYYNIPMNIAVQWRFIGPNTPSSNAESPEGWNNFDYLYFSEGEYKDKDGNTVYCAEEKVFPQEYTDDDRSAEIVKNKGLSEGTKAEHNPYWVGSDVFKLTPYKKTNALITDNEEILRLIDNGIITSTRERYYEEKRSYINHYPYVDIVTIDVTFDKYEITALGKEMGYSVVNTKTTSEVYETRTIPEQDDEFNKSYDAKNFNINERRYIFKKIFTEEECRKLAGFDSSENILDLVEVRVIRITPCYIAESGVDSETRTDMSFQDLFKWSYLRTKTFDKSKYLKALKEAAELGNTNNVKVENYIERPQPIDEDMNKFVYIAFQAKEDATGSMGGTVKKLSCITESFNPKYSEVEDKWLPEDIWDEYQYWHKTDDDIELITQLEYEENIPYDQEHYIKQRKGNDFTTQIRDEIFIRDNLIKDSKGDPIITPIIKYKIPEEVANKYISSNTAAQMANVITGSLLSSDAKTYDCLQMDKLTDFYKFCEDVTDGTSEKYLGINPNYINTLDNCNPTRLHAKNDFVINGYTDFKGDYGTDFASTWANELGNKAVVVTGVKNNGMLTSAKLDELKAEWELGRLSDTSVIMATFEGSTAIQQAEYYAQAYHMVMTAYFEGYSLYNIKPLIKKFFTDENITVTDEFGYLAQAVKCFELLRTYPINALRRGIHNSVIKTLNENICKHEGIDVDPIYESYILDILEQTRVGENQADMLVDKSDDKLHVKFECNGVISKEIKLETLLQKVLLTGRSYIKRSDENKYEPLIGRPNPYPVTVLNQRNVISKSNTKSYEELPCGFQVTCIDEDDNYTTNDFYVMAKGEDYTNPSAKIEQFQLDYVTNKWQLASLARFNLATRLYQLEGYTRTVGMLGYSITLGDTVLLQDDSLLIGTDRAGRIMELLEDHNYIYGFATDEPFEYLGEIDEESGLCKQGCTVLQPSQKGASRCVTLRCATPTQTVTVGEKTYCMTKGLTNLFLFSLAINKSTDASDDDVDSETLVVNPKVDNVVAFGDVNSITTKAVVMQIKPSEKGQFTLTLAPYNEKLYESGFEAPVFKSNMTIRNGSDDYGFNDNVTTAQLQEKSVQIAEQISPDINNVSIVSEGGYIFTSKKGVYTPSSITLKAIVTGVLSAVDCKWYIGETYTGVTGDTFVVTPDKAGVVKCVCDDYYDTITVAVITDGDSSISLMCNNESFSIPIDEKLSVIHAGSVIIQFDVYEGIKKLDPVDKNPEEGQFSISAQDSLGDIPIVKRNNSLTFTYSVGYKIPDVQNVIDVTANIGGVGTLTKSIIVLGVRNGIDGSSPYLIVCNDNVIIPVTKSNITQKEIFVKVDYTAYRGTSRLQAVTTTPTVNQFTIVKPITDIGTCEVTKKDDYTLTLNYTIGNNVDCSEIKDLDVNVKLEA